MAEAEQGELFAAQRVHSLRQITAYLNDDTRIPVSVVLTRNRVSMITVEFVPDGPVKVRMHEQFQSAPAGVIHALRVYVRTRRRDAWRRVAAFAQEICPGPAASRPRQRLRTTGRVYNLREIRDEVNREFFSGRVSCGIGWGRGRRARRRHVQSRSIRFGSWNAAGRTVRVHPALDDERVPREFVRYIVFHEMLHAVVPSRRSETRRYDHPPEFRALERTFPDWRGMHAMARDLVNVLG